jgi:K+-transporting ATPase ATPase A chain
MTFSSVLLLGAYLVVIVGLGYPLGLYMARLYDGTSPVLGWLGPLERLLYRVAGVRADEEMSWRRYASALLLFNLFGVLVVYGLQRLQGVLPLNPAGLPGVPPEVAFNTAVSFATNTNWQAYGGETTMSHLTQMAALTVQNFVSAATGLAVLVALIRGFTRRLTETIGSFWVDLVRGTVYVLLPLSLVLALVLVSQGVVQTLDGAVELAPAAAAGQETEPASRQIALGPVASQVAIKQLGTNGGGFFNVNSAHPLENPTPFSNLLQMLAILLIPAALCFTFGAAREGPAAGRGALSGNARDLRPAHARHRRGRAGRQPNPALTALGLEPRRAATWRARRCASASYRQRHLGDGDDGRLERLGQCHARQLHTARRTRADVADAVRRGRLRRRRLRPVWHADVYAIIAVFIAGLMVGRTPEYLGKKIEAYEMKMASLVMLFPVGRRAASAPRSPVLHRRARRRWATRGARLLRDALCVLVGGEQQRFGVRGTHRERAFYYGRPRHLRCMVLGRYWRDRAGAGHRRLARPKKKVVPDDGRHAADAHPPLRGPARRHVSARRRADVHPGAGPRTRSSST